MPGVRRNLGQRHPPLVLALLIEEAKLDPGRVLAEDSEVRPGFIRCGAERKARPWQDAHCRRHATHTFSFVVCRRVGAKPYHVPRQAHDSCHAIGIIMR
jgi:hypothetical protein